MDETKRLKINNYSAQSLKKSFIGTNAKVQGNVTKYSNTATSERIFARWNDFHNDLKVAQVDESLVFKVENFVVTFQNLLSVIKLDSSIHLVPMKFSLDGPSVFCEWIFPQTRFGFNFSSEENTWTMVKKEDNKNFVFKSETYNINDLPKILIRSMSLI